MAISVPTFSNLMITMLVKLTLIDMVMVMVMLMVMTIPDICHGRHGRCPCKFFLAGVFFLDVTQKVDHFTV